MRRMLGLVPLLAVALMSVAVAACNGDRSATGASPYSMDDPNRPGATSGGGGGGGY